MRAALRYRFAPLLAALAAALTSPCARASDEVTRAGSEEPPRTLAEAVVEQVGPALLVLFFPPPVEVPPTPTPPTPVIELPPSLPPPPPVVTPPVIRPDDVGPTPTPVENSPEPATLVTGLVGMGLAGLYALRRRRTPAKAA